MIPDKKLLREEGRRLRKSLLQEIPTRSLEIQSRLLSHPWINEAGVIALYAALAEEINVLPVWKKFPDRCAFPRTEGNTLSFYKIERDSDLAAGAFGILEPPANPTKKVTKWTEKDLILVPGIWFDRHGGRIGSGKGFYDRFLSSSPARKLGICCHELLYKGILIQEKTDSPMHAVLTNQEWISCP